MALLTLTTDWGLRDHYVAAFKGELIGLYQEIQLIDVTHDVEHFNILQASFILKSVFKRFPKGTIHYIGLNAADSTQKSQNTDLLIVSANDHYFVGQDSGIFSLLLGETSMEIVRIVLPVNCSEEEQSTILMNSLIALVKGAKISELGEAHPSVHQSYLAQPTVDSDSIRATILYIDSFGNVIVNVDKELFERERRNRDFTIFLRKQLYDINKISAHYHEVEIGEIVAIFNRQGFLEIALNHDSAALLLGLKMMDPIRIEFYDR
ncbi:MAG TPA: SAM-dependent chlorinase/fluorinase [Bacteroidia bacterium]|mgnify:CR=1 FL=1|nr:SAM-dependent chlorinase/fluorinase [Bacteroidia bacterium]HNP99682.1 SAM-dependent chlorinase/fluorinase [Bacteroidia bacterium]